MRKMPFKKNEATIFTFIIWVLTLSLLIYNGISLFFVKTDSIRSILIFNTLESLLMLALIAIPVVFTKITRFKIPEIMEVLYIIFCAGSIIFGEILDYYGKFGWWDSLLHTMSGIMFGILGYIILNTFNRYDGHNTRFSPIIMSAWTVCFTVTMGVIWELIEFSCDEFLGTNMQQYLVGRGTLDQGEALVGHEALRDTMKDLGLDLIGSLIPAIIGYFELRRQKKGFAYMYLEKETNPSVETINNKEVLDNIDVEVMQSDNNQNNLDKK